MGIRLESRPISVGSFAANLRSFETVRDFIASATITAVIDVPFTLIFLLLLFWIAAPMVLPALIGIVVVTIFSLSMQKRMERLTETTYRASAQRNANLIESLVSLDTVKAMSAEGAMQKKWENSASFLARVSIQLRLLAASNLHFVTLTQQLVTICVVVTGVYLISEGEITMGALIACSMLSGRALGPFSGVAGLLTQFHHARTALLSLNEIMAKPIERSDSGRLIHRSDLRGKIEFKNVSFTYPESDQPAISNMSFVIQPGEHVALLGRIGSGKSSIEKLILGLYQPSQGTILIDDIDIRQLDLAELRQHIGYVSQDTTLFYGTLRENITMPLPHASEADLIRATEFANLAEFVNTHPKGFDMIIGERGDSLSGGQRKSVGLARAVIGDPHILLLDEPTGAMDHSAETWVTEKLQSYYKNRTLMMVTHRSSILKIVDRIIVVDNGKIVADGPRDNVAKALREGRIGKAL